VWHWQSTNGQLPMQPLPAPTCTPLRAQGCSYFKDAMQLRYVLLAVLLGSVVGAAAATKSAARQLASTVGGRNDPEVIPSIVFKAVPAVCLTKQHCVHQARTWHLHVCAGARTTSLR
jgi:hypothetical protein